MPHEARERDYFFVLGFWAWGLLGGLRRGQRSRERAALAGRRSRSLAALLPLALNWSARTDARARARRRRARSRDALLDSAPPQRGALRRRRQRHLSALVSRSRWSDCARDVTVVTLPLLPARVVRGGARAPHRTALADGRACRRRAVAARAAGGADRRAARAAGRPVAASPLALGARSARCSAATWRLSGVGVRGTPRRVGRAAVRRPVDSGGDAVAWLPAGASRDAARAATVDDVARGHAWPARVSAARDARRAVPGGPRLA